MTQELPQSKHTPDIPEKIQESLQELSPYEQMAVALSLVKDLIPGTQEADLEKFNFSLESTQDDKSKAWTFSLLHKQTGEKIVLNEFLPDETWKIFVYGGDQDDHCDLKDNIIRLNDDTIKTKEFLLVLMHEIGHAHQKNKKEFNIEKRKKVIGDVLRLFRGVKKIFSSRQPVEHIAEVTPLWYQEELAKYSVLKERNAWAYALTTLRKLEKRNFNVFAQFDSYRDIQNTIGYNLLMHQIANNFDLEIAANTENRTPDNYPAFVKKDFVFREKDK